MNRKLLPHHEYWPSWALYVPLLGDYVAHARRLRSLRYPFVVNPGIPLGGAVGESKWEIYRKLPESAYPRTLRVEPGDRLDTLPVRFPCVAKPDVGERGLGVCFVESRAALEEYHRRAPRTYLLQDFVEAPFEAGVFFAREDGALRVTSIGVKRVAAVVGDGQTTLRELCRRDPRFARQLERLATMAPGLDWSSVPAAGSAVILDPIRNHRRGARFDDGRSLASDSLARALEKLIPASSGIDYGRADLRCPSEEHLRRGEQMTLVEVNGVTGEPAEIYDPTMSLAESLRILRDHWRILARLGERELARGRRPPPWRTIIRSLYEWRARPAFDYR